MYLVAGKKVRWIIEGLVGNQMKNNEKVPIYIMFFQLCFKKSPYPAYEFLKPYLPYIEAIWEQIRPVKGSIWPFLCFSDTKYHFNIKGA